MRVSAFKDGVPFKFKDRICYKTQFQDYTLLVTIAGHPGVTILDNDIDVVPIQNVSLKYTVKVGIA